MTVTLLSCVVCLAFYELSKRIFLPFLYKTFAEPGSKPYEQRFDPFERKVHAQKLVSFFHSLISTYGSLMCVIPYEFSIQSYANLMVFDEPKIPQAIAMRAFYMEITLGYFFADLLMYMADFSKYPKIDILHHVISSIAYSVCLMSDMAGSFAMICLQTNEISTPFYHIRFFMGLDPTLKKTKWYLLCEAVFSILFLIFRIFYNAIVLLACFKSLPLLHNMPYNIWLLARILLVIGCLYYLVQTVWFFKILQIIYWKITASKSASSSTTTVNNNVAYHDKKRK
jgi:hypothetical protein